MATATATPSAAVARRPAPTPAAAPARSPGGVRALNPQEYKAEFRDLIAVNPTLAADSATKLAMTKKNLERQLNAASEGTADIVAFLLSTGIVALVGIADGAMLAKRDAILKTWEDGGLITEGEEPPPSLWKDQKKREPGKLWIFPINLLIPIGLGTIAVVAAASRDEHERAGMFERVMAVSATSTFGLWVAGLTRGTGYRWQSNRQMGSATTGTTQTGT